MEEVFKLKGGGIAVLLYQFLRLVIILTLIIAVPLFLFVLQFKYIPHVEIAIAAVSFLICAGRREAETIRVEADRLYITGRILIFIKFKTSANYKNIRYRFAKNADGAGRVLGIGPSKPTLILYKNKRKWVEFTSGSNGWSRSGLADLVKVLLAKGCYNWFDFNKR